MTSLELKDTVVTALKWKHNFNEETFSGKEVSKKDVQGFVEWIYEELGLESPSHGITICSNYHRFIQRINLYRLNSNSLNIDFKDLVQITPIRQVYDKVPRENWLEIQKQVEEEFSVIQKISFDLEHQESKSSKETLTELVEKRRIGLGCDSWLRFYDYYIEQGIVDDSKYERFREFVQSGIWEVVFFRDEVIICKLPKKILVNKSGLLHDQKNEAALQWHDGTQNHYKLGICIDNLDLGKSQLENILAISNIEQRYAMMKSLDFEELAKESLVELVNSSARGNELYEMSADGNDFRFVKYKDPSTKKIYWSFVPEEFQKADEAMAWKFDLTLDEYENLAGEA